MENLYFSSEMLERIVAFDGWRVISSLFTPETHALRNAMHEKWMLRHIDTHPHREVMLCLSGEGVYGYQGGVYHCVPGTVFLFDSYEPHDLSYPPNSPDALHLWLSLLDDRAIVRLLPISAGGRFSARHSFVVDDSSATLVLGHAWDMAARAELPEKVRRVRVVSALASLFASAVEQGYSRTKPAELRNKHADDIISSIMRSIALSGGGGLDLDKLSRYAGYSKFHFLRLFKRHAGMPVHKYIDQCRINKSKELARKGLNKSQIAQMLGFSSVSVYCRWMANYTGKGNPIRK